MKAHVARSLFSHASTGRHTSIPYTLHLSLPFEPAEPRSHRWLRSRIGPWTTDRTTVLYKLIGSLRKHGRMPCPHVARHKILARVRSLVVNVASPQSPAQSATSQMAQRSDRRSGTCQLGRQPLSSRLTAFPWHPNCWRAARARAMST